MKKYKRNVVSLNIKIEERSEGRQTKKRVKAREI